MINNVDAEKDKFICNAKDYWIDIREGNSKQANIKERANRLIVGNWTAAGDVVEILTPLLIDSSSAVRFAAAAYLIKTNANIQAQSVLKNLIEVESGLIATSAAAVLRINNIK